LRWAARFRLRLKQLDQQDGGDARGDHRAWSRGKNTDDREYTPVSSKGSKFVFISESKVCAVENQSFAGLKSTPDTWHRRDGRHKRMDQGLKIEMPKGAE
jgi:hypothetical protein